MLKKQGYKPNIAARCGSAEAVRAAVRRNTGVGILYDDSVKEGLKRGEIARLAVPEFKLKGESFIMYHKNRRLSANARDFLALLRQWKKKIELSEAVSTRRLKTVSPCPVVSAGWAFLVLLDILF